MLPVSSGESSRFRTADYDLGNSHTSRLVHIMVCTLPYISRHFKESDAAGCKAGEQTFQTYS
jgi:hypothetical protein